MGNLRPVFGAVAVIGALVAAAIALRQYPRMELLDAARSLHLGSIYKSWIVRKAVRATGTSSKGLIVEHVWSGADSDILCGYVAVGSARSTKAAVLFLAKGNAPAIGENMPAAKVCEALDLSDCQYQSAAQISSSFREACGFGLATATSE